METESTLRLPDWQAIVAAFAGVDAEQAWKTGLGQLAKLGLRESAAGDRVCCTVEAEHVQARFCLEHEWDEVSLGLVQQLLAQALHRREQARALARLEERVQMLSNASFEGILFHADGHVIDANHRIAELLACDYDEVFEPGRNVIAPEDLPTVQRHMMAGYEGTYVVSALRKDGTRFRAELQSKQGRLGERPVRVIAVRDVTERERVERLLRESESRFRELVDAAFDLTVLSQQGIIVDVSGPLLVKLGYLPSDMIGRSVLDFVAPSTLARTREVLRQERHRAMRDGIVAANGLTVPVEVVAVTSTLDGKPTRVSGLRDLSEAEAREQERRKLQQQLERAQRLDSLGVLAGGIAHDFNNLLVGIIGNADFLLENCRDPESRADIEAILASGTQAANLTARMLAYAGRRNELGERRPIELAQLAQQLQVMLSATLSKKAQLEIDVADDCIVLGEPTPLSQVLMNLLTNASDALGGEPGWIRMHGRVLTQVGPEWDDALGATISPGRWVLLVVEDNGEGMDEETLGRAFEPFFTTKEDGHGLGLAACLGIIKSLGGALRLESAPGRGSRFSLLLPATREQSAQPESSEPDPPAPCRVLLVDDESVVRAQMRRVLELRGFSVVEAGDGSSALSLLALEPFDLVMLDLTMPDMDGAAVANEIRERGHALPIVMTSGYFAGDVERRLAPGTFQAVLHKPYIVAELMEAIARARRSSTKTA